MSKYYGDCYYLNCLHSFKTKSKFEAYKKKCDNKSFCSDGMPCKKNVIEVYLKFTKTPVLIYSDIECGIKNTFGSPCDYSMCTICAFDVKRC